MVETKELWSIRIDFALKPDDALRLQIETVMEELGTGLVRWGRRSVTRRGWVELHIDP